MSVVSSLSILIPTHDRAEILVRSLGALGAVPFPSRVDAEVVVVSNTCTDETEDRVEALARSFPVPLRLVSESTPGLNPARNAGLRAATGQVLAYLDDDAFVQPGWLEALLRTFEQQPADLVAGRVELWWEAVDRPPWCSEQVEQLLSRLDLGPDTIELLTPGNVIGANFAVRSGLARELGGFDPELDRAGSQLLSGGDTEFAHRAARAGCRIYYSPGMHVKHWIAPYRVSTRYLARLARGRGRTLVALNKRHRRMSRARLVRYGLSQIAWGGLQELGWRLRGDPSRCIAGRLVLCRGIGTVGGVFGDLIN